MKKSKLEVIEDQCRHDGPCWIWTGCTDDSGRPIINYKGRVHYVRKLVRTLVDGREVPPGLQVACKCGQMLCVSPECSVSVTPKKRAQMAADRGAFNRPDYILKTVKTIRAKSRITDDMVRGVREFEGPAWKAAQEHGISESYAKSIRRGTARKDLANPFAGLGGRP